MYWSGSNRVLALSPFYAYTHFQASVSFWDKYMWFKKRLVVEWGKGTVNCKDEVESKVESMDASSPNQFVKSYKDQGSIFL